MDFNYKKPAHYIPVLLLLITIYLFLIEPIRLFFTDNALSSVEDLGLTHISDAVYVIFQALFVLLELFLALFLLVIIPLLWYLIINKQSLKGALVSMQLQKKNMKQALLWAGVAVAASFTLSMIIGLAITMIQGVDVSDVSNITQYLNYLSLPAIFIIAVIQPVAEEIFFRGFLLEKFQKMLGPLSAVILTSVLFGIAHLLPGNAYNALLSIVIGIVLALVVLETKNLYTAIIAHILLNVMSMIVYIMAFVYFS